MADWNPWNHASHDTEHDRGWTGFLIGPVFLLLAAWFVLGDKSTTLPHSDPMIVDRAAISTEPLRNQFPVPPDINIAGYAMKCMDCHRLFGSPDDTARRRVQHTQIQLDHGLNDRCFNCHDRLDRNKLVLRGGQTVSFENVARVCGGCHGPAYRDWQLGMHGRTDGHWNPAFGTQRRLTCNQCHDPHAPAINPITALPGPQTIRMTAGVHKPAHGDAGTSSPLLRWSTKDAHTDGSASPDSTHDPISTEGEH